jgi:hypothetical protein
MAFSEKRAKQKLGSATGQNLRSVYTDYDQGRITADKFIDKIE